MIKTTLLSTALTFFAIQTLCGAAQSKVTIVDHNGDLAIKELIQTPAIIGVFGATPRYSAFEDYIDIVRSDLSLLQAKYQKSKKMKGIEQRVRQHIAALATNPTHELFDKQLKTADHDRQMDLFFDSGIDHQTLTHNVSTLVKTAHSSANAKRSLKQPEHLYLAHLLLPSYFTDLPQLKQNPNTRSLIHHFLKRSAQFYQKMYASQPEIDVCIIIPPLEYFIAAIDQSDADKLILNATVVQQELIAKIGSKEGYILLNQNGPELESMVNYLQKLGTPKVGGAQLPIQDSKGMQTTIFNPYHLKKGRKHVVANSPLINEQLISYAQRKKESSSREEKKDE